MTQFFRKTASVAVIALLCPTIHVFAQRTLPPVEVAPYTNTVNPDDTWHMARSGIMITGKGDNVRAFSAFSMPSTAGTAYAEAANTYARQFGDKVKVYCMPIPIQGEYYTPNSAAKSNKSQRPVINNIFAHLDDAVSAVDIYTTLGEHAAEPIYARTDHHWLPLGAYYAAQAFAKVADVPFRDLSNYDTLCVHRFLGTMYMFSKDMAVKRAPEDFVYYVPRDVDYTTTFIEYTLDSSRKRVIKASEPKEGQFFRTYKDGSSGAYCTFMGGDSKLVKVKTSQNNGRRLLILKDSFGNAIPGYLFYSFEEIHVVDCRYFTKNIVDYVNSNHITDILFANNIQHALAKATTNAYARYLTQ